MTFILNNILQLNSILSLFDLVQNKIFKAYLYIFCKNATKLILLIQAAEKNK